MVLGPRLQLWPMSIAPVTRYRIKMIENLADGDRFDAMPVLVPQHDLAAGQQSAPFRAEWFNFAELPLAERLDDGEDPAVSKDHGTVPGRDGWWGSG